MWNSCWSGDELVILSGHIVATANPCVVGVEIRIHRFDVITMGWNVGVCGVQTRNTVLLFPDQF